jgi:ATP-dependent RNA helicase HrpB
MRLPIEDVLPELIRSLRESSGVILEAPPGAGKTTRVPLAVLDEDWLAGQRVVMLEPRRLAARAAAEYMAAQRAQDVGGLIGYRMRGDTRISAATRVEVVTEGVLTRMLQADPALEGVGLVIFDEFHERSLQADTGLAFILQSRALLRPQLRLLLMSATLDGDGAARLLDDAIVVRSTGRVYDVETVYLDRRPEGRIEDVVTSAVRRAVHSHEGDVLVFLPGSAEIRRTAAQLADLTAADGAVEVMPLYGDLPRETQRRAILPSPRGRRKIVLATSIAETSLTIDGVRIVIDSGLMRVPRFSARTGMTRLETIRVTRDSADQRRGRAGRTAHGVCYRLWTEGEDAGLVPRRTPEILDADLAPLALDLAAWGVTDPQVLRWIDAPPEAALAQANELLFELGAMGRSGGITAHGRRIATIPTHPRLAHMLLAARDLGLDAMACDIAALIDERDILRTPGARAPADVTLRLDLLNAAGTGSPRTPAGVDRATLARVRKESIAWRRRLARTRRDPDATARDRPPRDAAGLLLAFAWPDRIGRRRGSRGRFLLRNGRGVVLPAEDALAGEDFIVAALTGGAGPDDVIYLAAAIEAATIDAHFGDQIEHTTVVEWDRSSRSVRCELRQTLGAIVLARHPSADVDAGRVAATLLDGLRTEGIGALPWPEAANRLRERVTFLHTLDAEWPDLAGIALTERMDHWLAPWLEGITSLDALRALDLHRVLMASLEPGQRARLDALAPTHVDVPSGSRIPIDYSDPAAPVLAVRLQEVFGMLDTPRLAGGRIPLTLKLLSPAMRPVQVTRDLASFWRSGYFDVKKDLKGRYPKHYWPDDPLTATATRRVRPRPRE